MKWEHAIIIVLMILSFWLIWEAGDPLFDQNEVFISKVIDGDTVETSTGEKIRLKGINTPEKDMFVYSEAKEFLNELILNETVQLVSFGEDRYGRKLGYLFFEGENLNAKILENGFGHLYVYEDDKYTSDLRKAEEIARENEIGIWKKSENYGCLLIEEFVWLDETDEDSEKLILKNTCPKFEVVIKDDATHIYNELIEEEFILETQNIWNDAGDSIYIWDDNGLVLFERYL